MTKTKVQKYDFAKISVRPEVKREIDVIAAMNQRPVYELVAEMLHTYKAALPRPAETVNQGA